MNKNSSTSNHILSHGWRMNKNELMAWIVLVCAILLFTFSVAVAQDNKPGEKSTVHIKIEKNENGKITKIDTTVSKDQLPALKEYLEESGIDLESDDDVNGTTRSYSYSYSDSDSDSGAKKVIILNDSKLSKEDREDLKKEMKKLHETMAKVKDEMKSIHIEISGDEPGDNFNFDMDVPPPPNPPKTSHVYMYKYDDDEGDDNKGSKHHSYNYRYFLNNNDDVPDSLNDENHIVIRGKKGEGKPELEKEITGKNGEKIFVFKRKLPKEEMKEASKTSASLGISHVKVYPNPASGNISVSFTAKSKGDLSISITDAKGKEVYSDTKKDFIGEFYKQVDLSTKGKGAYFVKITQGDDCIIKKIIIE